MQKKGKKYQVPTPHSPDSEAANRVILENSPRKADENDLPESEIIKKRKNPPRKPKPEDGIAENGGKPDTDENLSPRDVEKTPTIQWIKNRNPLILLIGAVCAGMMAGFFLGYLILVLPLKAQLEHMTAVNSSGNSSSNQIKSDLSNTRLKQQEMETRYQVASNQLEVANQYIFLLRMKEQIAIAQLMVEQKEGYKARQALSEVQGYFDHLKPFILKKNINSSTKFEELLKLSLQHLSSDPEMIKTDLLTIRDQVNEIETTLFRVK